MTLLLTLRLLANKSKLPFILLSSPPLRDSASNLESGDTELLSPCSIAQQLASPVIPLSHSRDGSTTKARGAQWKQKEAKRRGFNAIIRWCAYHQEADVNGVGVGIDGITAEEDPQSMDAVVTQWVQQSVKTFSCGQSLVLLTFLCDVLQRRLHSPGPSPSETSASTPQSSSISTDDLIAPLAEAVTLLITRAVASDQLELQPFFVLLSAVYGLHRISACTTALLSAEVDPARLTAPPALWLALLHQVREFSTSAAGAAAADHLDASLTTTALWTTLLLFDHTRRTELFAPNDHKVMAVLERRLLAAIQPELVTARELRQRREAAPAAAAENGEEDEEDELLGLQAIKEEGAVANVAATGGEDGLVTLARKEGVAWQPRSVARFSGTTLSAPRMSLKDCAQILSNAASSSLGTRMQLLEYFVCVLHDPVSLSCDALMEMRQLFRAVKDSEACRVSGLAAYVLRCAGAVNLKLFAAYLSVVSLSPPLLRVLEELLSGEMAKSQTSFSAASPSLLPFQATLLLSLHRSSLRWDQCKWLLRCSLTSYVDLLAAVDAALERANDKDAIHAVQKADRTATRLPMSPLLFRFLQHLFFVELQNGAGLWKVVTDVDRSEPVREAMIMARAVARSVDWSSSSLTSVINLETRHREESHRATSPAAFRLLQLYLDAHYRFRFLSTEDEIDDRDLLNALVVPVLKYASVKHRLRVTVLLCSLLPHLKAVEFKRQLMERTIQLVNTPADGMSHFIFAHSLAADATALQVFSAPMIENVLRCRCLEPRHLQPSVRSSVNLLKTYHLIVVRMVRYLRAARRQQPALTRETAAFRERAHGWLTQYSVKLLEDEATTESVAPAPLPADAGDEMLDERTATEAQEKEVESVEEVEDAVEKSGDPAAFSSCNLVDEAFKVPVKEEDVEELLSLMLEVGTKPIPRLLNLVARRLREKASLPLDSAESGTVGTERCVSEDNMHHRELEKMAQGYELPLEALPLPAHFVIAVRADMAVAHPLTVEYLQLLLDKCDLSIYSFVVSAFYIALKRQRCSVVLKQDLKIAAIATSTLYTRLAALEADAAVMHGNLMELQSCVALKTLVSVLHHFRHLPSWAPQLLPLIKTLHQPASSAAGAEQFSASADTNMEDETVGEVAEEDEDADEATTEHDGPQLRQAHAAAAECVLQLCTLVTSSSNLKDLALSQLQSVATLFPSAAAFSFLRLQPQLSSFTQRELLQLATQYPAGAPAILTELQKLDLHASIDLGEFVPFIRKLPMELNEAVIRAHLPHLTVAWCTRILSSLAAFHEAVPISLLEDLLGRVGAVADAASESDKTLLLLILQGYLLFSFTTTAAGSSASAAQEKLVPVKDFLSPPVPAGQAAAAPEMEGSWMSELYPQLNEPVPRVPLTRAAQQQRTELVRRCCDTLLSLDHITSLEELRFFLVSYPPSLHRLRERGVVATVEQALLPALVQSSPLPYAQMDALVGLLADHHCLMPSTVNSVTTVLFTQPQLERLLAEAQTSPSGDTSAVLSACLRIAVWCASAVQAEGGHPNEPTFALLPAVDLVLSVFDALEDWLQVLPSLAHVSFSGGSEGGENGGGGGGGRTHSHQPVPSAQLTVARHLCGLLLAEAAELNPSEFAKLIQLVSRLRAWELAIANPDGAKDRKKASLDEEDSDDFSHRFCAVYARADAHSRCVMLRATTTDPRVFRRFEAVLFRVLQADIPLLSAEDLELVLSSALQVADASVVESLLDAVGTRLLPIMDQCRRSLLVRLLQCHTMFKVEDTVVISATLSELERQSPTELKLDGAQVLTVLQAIARVPSPAVHESLILLCFQRLEKVMPTLSALQLYSVGQLILELEMGYTGAVHALVTHILESRDGQRAHKAFQAMTEELCDTYDVEVAAHLRAARLRKRRHQQRIMDLYAAQELVMQEALNAH